MNENPLLFKLGQNIRRYREILGITQEELAFRAGLDRTYIGGIERGERNPTIISLNRIAEALNVSLATLVTNIQL